MAIQTNGQLVSAAFEALVGPDPTDNIFRRHWILEQLRSNGSFQKQNGTVIRHNIEYALNTNVKFMSELETLVVARPDTFDYAEYNWKFIGGDVPMTDFERAVTSGGAAKYDLAARKALNLKNSIEEAMNTSFLSDGTGTSSKEFGGLQLLVSTTPTTGTVGSISRVTYPFWRNQQASGTSAGSFANLLATMETMYNSCSNGIGEQNPTFIVTTQTVFEGYYSLTPAIERLVRDSDNNKLVRSFKGQNTAFKDCPIGYDPTCLAGVMYFLNNRNLFFIYMQMMKTEDAVRPADAFYDVVKSLTIGNMTTDNPRRLGVLTSIN